MTLTRGLILLALIAAVGAFLYFDGLTYLTLERLQTYADELAVIYAQHTTLIASLFFVFYAVYTGLSLPGAAPLTLLAGALFGVLGGVVLVSFASTLGATIACTLSRYLFRDSLQTRFADQLRRINEGMAADGEFYLFALRLVPAVPFFVVNLAMGLTRIRLWTFWWVSQIGMLAGTVVYVNAGSELAKIESLGDVVSPTLLVSFALLGILPIVAKKGVAWVRARRSASNE